jgi:hypothetical protein
MDATNFPRNCGGLTELMLGRRAAIPWSGTEAPSRFQKEVARSYPCLYLFCSLPNKTYFCLEVARLVNEGVLPNITDGDVAFDAARSIFERAGLRAVAAGLESKFATLAQSRASCEELAGFLSENYN